MSPSARSGLWFLIFPAVIALYLAIMAVGQLFITMQMENNDAFCASCHTDPQTTFFKRTLADVEQPVDLASLHAKNYGTKCIECHSGSGSLGRIRATLGGSVNLLTSLIGQASQSAKMRGAFPDANCLKCHSEIPATMLLDRHYHNFLSRWQASGVRAAVCADCHAMHALNGDPQKGFIDEKRIRPVCESCHTWAAQIQ